MDVGFWGLSPEGRDAAEFARDAADPDSWFEVARNLTAAAEELVPMIKEYDQAFARLVSQFLNSGEECYETTVERMPDVRAIYLMLAGYAAENLCKGAIVATDERVRESLAAGSSWPGELKHDLVRLLGRICFQGNEEDHRLARRLSRAVTWSARYPIPMKPGDIHRDGKGGGTAPRAFFSSQDCTLVRDFLSRLSAFCECNVSGISRSTPETGLDT